MTATQPDLYQVLGVSKDAELAEIRSAHRKLVLKCHPDKVQDPTLKAAKQDEFQKVQQAYEVLSSEKERRRYDESVRLAELKAQMQNRANVSATRSPKFEVKITSEVRPSKMPSSPGVKSYPFSPSSSYEERPSRSRSRYYDEPRHSKRAPSHADKSSYRRESEREKEREKDRDRERERAEREKERDRERRRKEKKEKEAAEEARRVEKAMKKEKKEREKQRTKDIRKDTEDKRRDTYDDIYVEEEEMHPHLEKKKSSSSRKHEERRERERTRERSARRDEPTTPRGSYPEESSYLSYARDYIRRTENSSLSYEKPPVPSPPNASKASPYLSPDDEIRRGSTKPRRGSMDTPRERTYHKSSREHLDSREPMMGSSPPKYSKSSARGDPMPSPPSLNRTATMPTATSTSAGRPTPPRAHTFGDYVVGGESPANRGRGRSKHEPQYNLLEESESEDENRRHRHDRKSRSSKKHRTPELGSETRYHVDTNGRTKLQPSYSYSSRAAPEEYASYYTEYADRRPSLYSRDSGYGTQYRVKTSKTFNAGDVAYSSYNYPSYGEEHPATAMA